MAQHIQQEQQPIMMNGQHGQQQEGQQEGDAPHAAPQQPLPLHMTYDALRTASINPQPMEDLYEYGELLDDGGKFGEVFRARCRATGQLVAIKRLRWKYYTSPKARCAALREPYFLGLQAQLGHPNLLQLHSAHEVMMVDAYGQHTTLAVVTTLAEGGSLLKHISGWQNNSGASASPYNERHAASILQRLAQAVQALHQAGILHLDLKPDNIFLRRATPPGSPFNADDVVLGDVGLSCTRAEAALTRWHDRGTMQYNAPEVHHCGICTEAADVWALGVILYILLCGEWPFGEHAPLQAYDLFEPGVRVTPSWWSGKAWETMTPEAKDLIQRMLTHDRERRITLPQVLAHPWFQAVNGAEPRALPFALTGIAAMTKASQFWARLSALTRRMGEDLPLLGATIGAEITNGQQAAVINAFHYIAGYRRQVNFRGFCQMLAVAGLPQDGGREAMLKRVFNTFDANHNGMVDQQELVAGLAALKASDLKTLCALFDLLDVDGTGHLDQAAVRKMMLPAHFNRVLSRWGNEAGQGPMPVVPGAADDVAPAALEAAFQQVFAELDREGLGRVSRAGFQQCVAINAELRARLLHPVRTLALAMAPLQLMQPNLGQEQLAQQMQEMQQQQVQQEQQQAQQEQQDQAPVPEAPVAMEDVAQAAVPDALLAEAQAVAVVVQQPMLVPHAGQQPMEVEHMQG